MSYEDFFRTVVGDDRTPLPFQRRVAEASWPDCIVVPTGLGKTAAIIVAWLYKRLTGDRDTPRRLIYCLPMRVLVEQTSDNARAWATQAASEGGMDEAPSVQVLMGGAGDHDWSAHPERPSIIVGTQDMLLSRALMRGYGMSRYRWPIDFGLLHNDALWVFDEVQLMGAGLSTSAQLETLRRLRELRGPVLPSRTLWMSATLDPDWLGTVDFRPHLAALQINGLDDGDREVEVVRDREGATKHLARADIVLAAEAAKRGADAFGAGLAAAVLAAHRPGKTSLVIVNRVDRAQAVHRALQVAVKERNIELLLLHSRFRKPDRRTKEAALPGPRVRRDLIVVATQAIEAGVDLTSAVLFTELAPWTSLVQRFGRCNRYGELNDDGGGRIFWIDIAPDGDPLPYRTDELAAARDRLAGVDDASAKSIASIPVKDAPPVGQVLRRKDFIELFNTDPDLSGFDVDVAPFIRDAEDLDVHVFWRAFDQAPDEVAERARRDELCPVPVWRARDLLVRLGRKNIKGFVWDPLGETRAGRGSGRWVALEQTSRLYPGLQVMLPAGAGGYDPNLGFTGDPGGHVDPVVEVEEGKTELDAGPPEDNDGDPSSWIEKYVTLEQHTSEVCQELARLLGNLEGVDHEDTLRTAARWHDLGKAHDVFQETMRRNPPDAVQLPKGLLAKRKGRAYHSRRGFRHELASALAWLEYGDGPDRDLVAYLVAAHHGKVRMGIRALPIERGVPNDPNRRFARGIWDGEVLPEVVFADGRVAPETPLRLDIMELGGGDSGEESWTARTQRLLAEHGPFRLAFLEALLRIPDHRASAREEEVKRDDR